MHQGLHKEKFVQLLTSKSITFIQVYIHKLVMFANHKNEFFKEMCIFLHSFVFIVVL